jgi:hypothetical protein
VLHTVAGKTAAAGETAVWRVETAAAGVLHNCNDLSE